VFAVLGGSSCGSSDNTKPLGGAVTGALDSHCTVGGQMIKQAIGACLTGGQATDPDAGVTSGDDDAPVLYNAEGDDDDCKYHVSWTSTPVRGTGDVTFTVTLTRLADGAPATGADVSPEVFLGASHVTPTVDIPSVETPAASGIYKVGPIRFDQAGQWVVRFHFYERCADAPQDSPHGHASFYLSVP